MKRYRYSDGNTYTDNLTFAEARKFQRLQNGGTVTVMGDKRGHTAGPWQTGTRERGRFCVYAPQSNGRGICVMSNTQQVSPEMVAKYGEHGLNVEADANARLIAAAPEMLDALKQWEIILSADCDDGRTLTALRKLIAKAEGKTEG